MEELSTTQHAETIAESLANGQRKQAVGQFSNAMFDGVSAATLLEEIAEIIGDANALAFAARIIEG